MIETQDRMRDAGHYPGMVMARVGEGQCRAEQQGESEGEIFLQVHAVFL